MARTTYWLLATLVVLPITAVVLAATWGAPYSIRAKISLTAPFLCFLYLVAALVRAG